MFFAVENRIVTYVFTIEPTHLPWNYACRERSAVVLEAGPNVFAKGSFGAIAAVHRTRQDRSAVAPPPQSVRRARPSPTIGHAAATASCVSPSG